MLGTLQSLLFALQFLQLCGWAAAHSNILHRPAYLHNLHQHVKARREAQALEAATPTPIVESAKPILTSSSPIATVVSDSAIAYPSPTSVTTYTIITPSPSASPIPITEMSQIITTFIPQVTLCPLSSSATSSSFHWSNSSTPALPASPSSRSCTTHYRSQLTTICHTTLQGLATNVTISKCGQTVTFSSQYGYTLSLPASTLTETDKNGSMVTVTAAPEVHTMTSYFMAPWQALTIGLMPQNITQRICSSATTTVTPLSIMPTSASASASAPAITGPITATGRQCIDIHESWSTFTVTSVTKTTSIVDFTTTITGPSEVIIETLTATVKESETVLSLSTEVIMVVSTEKIQTRRMTVKTGTVVSSTITVVEASTSPSASHTSTSTMTVTVLSTTTHTPTGFSSISNSFSITAPLESEPIETTSPPDTSISTITIQSTSTMYSGTSTQTISVPTTLS